MILQQPHPDDYILATGASHTVRNSWSTPSLSSVVDIRWCGKGIHETGIDETNDNEVVKVDPRYFRPTEVDTLVGDATKAHKKLGWRRRVDFDSLVREMVEEDRKALRGEAGIRRKAT